jgi:hypothetical protein
MEGKERRLIVRETQVPPIEHQQREMRSENLIHVG